MAIKIKGEIFLGGWGWKVRKPTLSTGRCSKMYWMRLEQTRRLEPNGDSVGMMRCGFETIVYVWAASIILCLSPWQKPELGSSLFTVGVIRLPVLLLGPMTVSECNFKQGLQIRSRNECAGILLFLVIFLHACYGVSWPLNMARTACLIYSLDIID